MVFVQDEGSLFDAPIEVVWEYIFGGGDHDQQHPTTRNAKIESVSEVTLLYNAERKFRGKWGPDRLRISMFRPVSVVTEWLAGPLEGSKLVYLYSPLGPKTRIDVYGEFTSKTLPEGEVEAAAREWLAGEFRDDAPAVRALAETKPKAKAKPTSKPKKARR
ncbi:MAG: hypothetical protein L3K16_07185 [Thermoplasmata archaeon]|nr:hypothetical protein [Thermoplasmata archaeon]